VVFSSIFFLFWFLPIFLWVYYLAPRKLKNYVILAASIFFYSWGAPKFVFVILASTLVDFYIVKTMYRSELVKKRQFLLACSLFLNLGLLLYFKYANFFVENVNAVIGKLGADPMPWIQVALPIGISFYTFQTLTYAIDVYRKDHSPLRKPTDYLLYIMSFPQMIAGPIVRFSEVADQIENRNESMDDRLIGLYRFTMGLAKKVLIANVMGEQADLIFNAEAGTIGSFAAWVGIIAYTFQIYFDFSGYSDMAIGLGRMMGFRFPENFDSPYTSGSISEFWRRWHITLGSFMRDYLYIPLGGNRVDSKLRLYFNLWVVFLLSGLWHGASWNFVIWGAFHGFFLILDRLFLLKVLKSIGKVPAMLVTFLIVMIGWVFFRIESFDGAISFLQLMFSFDWGYTKVFIPGALFIGAIACFFAFFCAAERAESIMRFFYHRDTYSLKQHLSLAALSVVLFVFSASALTASGFNPFIYFRF
jgi:alginate O-acetyltransferase complex protein AlgI